MDGAIPAISRLDDLDRIVRVLYEETVPKVETARLAIGRAVEELALRGEARQNRDWRDPVAYRDPTVDCLRELIRWGLVEPAQLADTAEGFLRIRQRPIRLTQEGRRFAQLPAPQRREQMGDLLLKNHSLFRQFIAILQRFDIVLPELSDAEVKGLLPRLPQATDDQDGWMKIATACERRADPQASLRAAPAPPHSILADGIGQYLRKRFGARSPKNMKELTGATNKGIAHTFLRTLGFHGDWNAYDRCLRWARDLYIGNDGRHVFGVTGWIAWPTATVVEVDGLWRFRRRGYTAHRAEVQTAIFGAYQKLRGSSRTSLLPIYELRETAAFYARVSDAVFDRVLGDLVTQRSADQAVDVCLHLADLKDFVPSARPFRLEGKKYFYVSITNRQKLDREQEE
jgi:hypothetical protein